MRVENESQEQAGHRLGAKRSTLEVVRAYPGNADAWEALWLSDEAIGAVDEQELFELTLDKS
jgi:hypothetical protein